MRTITEYLLCTSFTVTPQSPQILTEPHRTATILLLHRRGKGSIHTEAKVTGLGSEPRQRGSKRHPDEGTALAPRWHCLAEALS